MQVPNKDMLWTQTGNSGYGEIMAASAPLVAHMDSISVLSMLACSILRHNRRISPISFSSVGAGPNCIVEILHPGISLQRFMKTEMSDIGARLAMAAASF